MLRDRYHHEMQSLEDRTLDLGRTVAGAVYEAADAFVHLDRERAEAIVRRDKAVNRERLAIQSSVLTLIATQQPVASDVRLLAAILESVAEIERIGDYAKGIASITQKVEGEPFPPAVLGMLLEMAELARSMLRRCLDAFQERDAATAVQIITEDDAVDVLFKEAFRTVLGYGAGDPQTLEAANYLLWVAHNLERTADRVTNIGESVLYLVSGELVSGRKMAVDEFLSSLQGSAAQEPEGDDVAPGAEEA